MNDFNLTQVMKIPTRGNNILHLFLTYNPSLIIKNSNLPGLGDSDHDIILVETMLRPIKSKKNFTAKPQYNKTNWELFRAHMETFTDSFLNLYHNNMSVDDL